MVRTMYSAVRVIVAAAVMQAGSAMANDHCGHAPIYKTVVSYKCVTTYENRVEPYTKLVVKYDECGRCRYVNVSYCRTVQVPVVRRIPVYTKVCVY